MFHLLLAKPVHISRKAEHSTLPVLGLLLSIREYISSDPLPRNDPLAESFPRPVEQGKEL